MKRFAHDWITAAGSIAIFAMLATLLRNLDLLHASTDNFFSAPLL